MYYVALAAAAVVVVFLVVVALRPSELRVVRSAVMAAPASAVFAEVNDFHRWEAWSPWAKRDPAMRQTYEGPAAGTGAVYTWAGNRNVGHGRMTLTESRPHDLIRIRLDFYKPFPGTNEAVFAFAPDGDRTTVTWTMTGRQSFIPKAVGLFLNMDKMIGDDFATGLAGIKAVVERAARPAQAAVA